jgi:hypothetical protein
MVPMIMKARYGPPKPKASDANRTSIGPVVHPMNCGVRKEIILPAAQAGAASALASSVSRHPFHEQ